MYATRERTMFYEQLEKRDGGGEEGGREAKVLKVCTFNAWKIDRLRAWFPRNGCSCRDNFL